MHNGDTEVPKTILYPRVVIWNLILFVIEFLLMTVLLYPLLENKSLWWSGFMTLATIGILFYQGSIAVDISDYHGGLVFDPLTKKRRVVFQGLHLKLLWEKLEDDLTSLLREISSRGTEAGPTNDPAEGMIMDLLIFFRVDTSGTPKEAAVQFMRFRSIEEHALTDIIRSQIVRMFRAYYGEHELEELVDPQKIQIAVLSDSQNRATIDTLEEKYGIHVGVELKNSEADTATKALKGTPARAEGLKTAILKLMSKGPNGEEGLTLEQARRAALLLDPNADFTESRSDFDVNLNAKGLENLRDVQIIPPEILGGKKGGGKK